MRRKSETIYLAFFLILTASGLGLYAQRNGTPNSPGNAGYCNGGGPGITAADIISLEGIVDSVNLERGLGTPSIVLNNGGVATTFLVGPYARFLDEDFQVQVGDMVSIRAFPSTRSENTYVAIELANITTGQTLTLRDDAGRPLGWHGRGHRRGGRCCGNPGV